MGKSLWTYRSLFEARHLGISPAFCKDLSHVSVKTTSRVCDAPITLFHLTSMLHVTNLWEHIDHPMVSRGRSRILVRGPVEF